MSLLLMMPPVALDSVDVPQGIRRAQPRRTRSAGRAGHEPAEQGEADSEQDQPRIDRRLELDELRPGLDRTLAEDARPPTTWPARSHRALRRLCNARRQLRADGRDDRRSRDADRGADDPTERPLC